MSDLEWTLAVRDVPDRGLTVERAATPEECGRLAAALAILSVEGVRLGADVKPRSGGRFELTGTLTARLTQACVVTLDPVPCEIDAALAIELRPAEALGRDDEIEAGESLLDEPDIEPIENGTVDLGRIVYEELASRLDPFPRAEGATLDQSSAGGGGPEQGPFAGLAALRRRHPPT
jgi:uncharacterized metal-binding protein YceD (DUF177 family)